MKSNVKLSAFPVLKPQTKTLYLIRGLPGSGKSTLARYLAPTYVLANEQKPNGGPSPASFIPLCFEADDYFVNEDGEYHFDPSLLSEAHENCRERVEEAMSLFSQSNTMRYGTVLNDHPDFNTIAVANTFSKRWEVAPYLKLAEEYGYSVFIIECQNDFGSIHGVPEEKVEAMRERWEELR